MKQVLIVDDNQDTRDVYNLCSTKDVHIATAATGADALALVEQKDFDAVLLDLSMHPLDGLTVAQQIRENEKIQRNKRPVHLAFFTARTIDKDVEEVAEETDVEKIFLKPCDPIELVEKVRQWLNNSRYFPPSQNGKPKQSGQTNHTVLVGFLGILATIFAIGYCQFQMRQQQDNFNKLLQGEKERAELAIHAEQEQWAKDWSLEKSSKDRAIRVCSVNLKNKESLEIFIQQKGLVAPASLLSDEPCP